MINNIEVVLHSEIHIGDDPDAAEFTDVPYVGSSHILNFDCPGLADGPANIVIGYRGNRRENNVLELNGRRFELNDPSPDPDFRLHSYSVEGLLVETGNTAIFRALDATGGTTGDQDDFVARLLVASYRYADPFAPIELPEDMQLRA